MKSMMQKFKNWRKKMKKTAKGRAYLKLIYWAIFFGILFILLFLASLASNKQVEDNKDNEEVVEETEENSEDEQISLSGLEEALLKGSYTYQYQITINETVYLLEGTKYETYEEGYKTVGDEIIRYYLDDTGEYQVTTAGNVLLTDFYTGFNADFLDLDQLFEKMNDLGLQLSALMVSDGDYVYTLNLNAEATSITSLVITKNDGTEEYVLSFEVKDSA